MQGSIFSFFSDMVVEKLGIIVWEELLDDVKPSTEGVYTTGAQYEDGELFSLVGALSEKTGIPVNDLVYQFGVYLFGRLYDASPTPLKEVKSCKELIKMVDSVIHVEVKRLYPDAYLPMFRYEKETENGLTLIYQSKRKLCRLCEGLLQGAASHFDATLTIDHPVCMHKGSDHCELHLSFE